jgi:hypothetical protein
VLVAALAKKGHAPCMLCMHVLHTASCLCNQQERANITACWSLCSNHEETKTKQALLPGRAIMATQMIQCRYMAQHTL